MARSKSSASWLREHEADPYVKQSRKDGYRSRASYKLAEIQHKHRLLQPGMRVVDLGAAPGGWCQVVRQEMGDNGQVIALDLLPIEPLPGVTCLQGDFTEEAVLAALLAELGDRRPDLVLSDMAPNLSGMKQIDQPRMVYLMELALDFCRRMLVPGGNFLVKGFQGEGIDGFTREMRALFQQVKIVKPKASRDRSKEFYLLGLGLKQDQMS